jgi:hypothetical protein
MASVQVHFSPEFLQRAGSGEQDRFSAEQSAQAWFYNSARAVLSGLQTPLEQPHFTSALMALWSSRTTLEQIIPGKYCS